jgi:hypothetical protein
MVVPIETYAKFRVQNRAQMFSRVRSKRVGALHVRLSKHPLLHNHRLELRHPGNRRYREPSGVPLAVLSRMEYGVGERSLCRVKVVNCEAACLQKNFPCLVEDLCKQATVIRIKGGVHAFHGGCPTTLTVTKDQENVRSVANAHAKKSL